MMPRGAGHHNSSVKKSTIIFQKNNFNFSKNYSPKV